MESKLYDDLVAGKLKDKFVIYLAAPFFNPGQIERLNKVTGILEAIPDVIVFSPSRDGILCAPDATREIRKKAFEMDVKSIDFSNAVVALIDEKDTGTTFEMGYCFKADAPLIAVAFEPTHKLNLMLSESFSVFCNSPEILTEYITKLINVNQKLSTVYKENESESLGFKDKVSQLKSDFNLSMQKIESERTEMEKIHYDRVNDPEIMKLMTELYSYKEKTIFTGPIE